jgi:hypothetical protein
LDHDAHNIRGELYREACDRGKTLSFRIISNSMSPLIEVGDEVRVNRAEMSRVRIGDVVAFHEGPKVVVHRIIGRSWSKQQLVFRHRGDAGAVSGKIPAGNVIGRVYAVKKKGKEISLGAPRFVIGGRVMGWRLRLLDIFTGMRPQSLSYILRLTMRPVWKLCQITLLWRP